MTQSRQSLGYVVQVDGAHLTVNLDEAVRSHVAGHVEGVSSFEQPGDLIAVEAGSVSLVARVHSISFAEPRELHGAQKSSSAAPLRQLRGFVIGILRRIGAQLSFLPQTTRLPALGAQVFPLSGDELKAVLGGPEVRKKLRLGAEARNPQLSVTAELDSLLSRHLAVLGSTGQGKTHFICDLVQQTAVLPQSRTIIFDLNGEYFPAFRHLGNRVLYTAVGSQRGRNAPAANANLLKIPYYALGRHGLFRLLLPSERTQAPALRFAVEHLAFVEADQQGARPVGHQQNALFDDCRTGDAGAALASLNEVKRQARRAANWPHFKAISCLVAENYSIKQGRAGPERDAFLYGHVTALINRVNSLIGDSRFTSVVEVTGGLPSTADLSLNDEAENLVQRIFGPQQNRENDPLVHVVDLSQLTQDLMPFVLGSLLELYAEQLFRRGAGNTHPTLLVLEEAHHYLRQLAGDADTGQHSLAYERLAKEGRKFGLSLLISTQRPSEVSPTVLSQCGSWAVFRLTNEVDKRSVASAAEDSGAHLVDQLSGLGRGEALAFGAAFPIPVRLAREPLPEDRQPDSLDPPFSSAWDPEV